MAGAYTYPDPLTAGAHEVTADYLGTASFAASNSGTAQTVTVAAGALTATAASSSPTWVVGTQEPTFSYTIPASEFFYRDTQQSVVSGNFSVTFSPALSSSNPVPGTYQIIPVVSSLTATSNYTFAQFVSGTLTVTAATVTTSTTLNFSPASPTYGTPVTLTATVATSPAGGGTPTGTVKFMDGSTQLGTTQTLTAGGPATVTTTATELPAGTDNLTAVYTPTGNFAGSSGRRR